MEERPKLQATLSSFNNEVEHVTCGCVMHRYKGHKTKRRWGKLRISVGHDQAKCVIQLFKHDLSQMSPDTTRTKEPKIKYEIQFTRSDFCGIEKGEHYDRHGIRRYLCIITKHKHLIIEDAVLTATGINHNVLGTWGQRVAEAMLYVNRWKVIENDPKVSANKVCYLHVTAENTSECHSLEDKTRENRTCLVIRTWRTGDLENVKEHETVLDGTTTTSIAFQFPDFSGGMSTVNLCIEGAPNLRQLVQQFRSNQPRRATTTVCPAFNDLDYSPNLVRLPPSVQPGKKIVGSMNRGAQKDNVKPPGSRSHGNLYVSMNADKNGGSPYYNLNNPQQLTCVEEPRQDHAHFRCPSERPGPSTSGVGQICAHDPTPKVVVAPSLAGESPTRCTTPEFIRRTARPPSPHNGWNASPSPPPLDDDFKKGPALATQTSFDSDYQTGDFTTNTIPDNEFYPSRPAYINVRRGHSNPDFSRLRTTPTNNSVPALSSASIYQNMAPRPPTVPNRRTYVNLEKRQSFPSANNRSGETSSQAPIVPPKTPQTNGFLARQGRAPEARPPIPYRPRSADAFVSPFPPCNDLIRHALQNDDLQPVECVAKPYENSIEFSTTIGEVLNRSAWTESRDRWLDLPHAVFLQIAFGLEKQELVAGDWKSFADELGLSLADIQQLHGLLPKYSELRPLEVLLLHWCRTQAPFPFSRAALKGILLAIQRPDLAALVPPDEHRRSSNDTA